MKINFFGLSMVAPDGRDESQVVIVDEKMPPRHHFSVTKEVLTGPFSDYVAKHDKVEGTKLVKKEPMKVGDLEAFLFIRQMNAPHASLLQLQALVLKASWVWAFTFSFNASEEAARTKEWTDMLNSIRWEN